MNYTRYKNSNPSRRDGFGMNLYRNTRDKKIAGVCAGLADHFEIDHTIMRLLFVAGLIFTSAAQIWVYIIAWIVMAPRPQDQQSSPELDDSAYEYDESLRRYRRKKMFRYKDNTSERIRRAKYRMNKVIKRVDDMERYVTSSKFNLNKQFADL